MSTLVGQPTAQVAAYARTITTVYTKRVYVTLLDRNNNGLLSLTPYFLEGQVNVDASSDVSRTATVNVLDVDRVLGFEVGDLAGRLNFSRQLRVLYSIDGPFMPGRLSLPVMHGPVSKIHRDGPVVTIDVQGREVYGLGQCRRSITLPKNGRKTDYIRKLLALMGETRMSIPDLPNRFPDHVTIKPSDSLWPMARKIAASLNMQLYYDGNGVARARTYPQSSAWTFWGDSSGRHANSLTAEPSIDSDLSQVRNVVVVTGATPKNKKTPPYAVATADASHPLSPAALAPSGGAMNLVEEVSNDHCKTAAECAAIAKTTLADMLLLAQDVSATAIPVPHLDPMDLVGFGTDTVRVSQRLRSFSLPLGPSGDMSVGYLSHTGFRSKGPRIVKVKATNPPKAHDGKGRGGKKGHGKDRGH